MERETDKCTMKVKKPNLYVSFENQYLSEHINHKNVQRRGLPSSVDIIRNTRQEVNTSHI